MCFTLGFISCVDSVKFPPEPFLRYESHELFAKETGPMPTYPFDRAEVNLYFTDGDGDLGQDASFSGILCRHGDSTTASCNLFIDVWSKRNGVFDTSYALDARIVDLEPSSQNPTLEGNIIYNVSLAGRFSDTVRIDFWMYDRSLNKSNIVSTPEIFVDL